MSKFYETDKFKKLNAKWQEKLKKDGFKEQEEATEVTDIHGVKKVGDRLKSWSTSFFRGEINSTQYEAKVTYFRLAGQFLHEYRFKNELEKRVWEHHANGLSMSKIAAEVGTKIGRPIRIVNRLAKVMKEKLKEENDD